MENGKIYANIIAVMKAIKAIGKDKKNQQQGFQYRGVDDIMNELHTALAENNVFIVPVVKENKKEQIGCSRNNNPIFETRMLVNFKFYADDGSFIESEVVGEACDSGDKGANKALSVAFKYACLQIFCIPTADQTDPDAETPDIQQNTKKKAPAPQQMAGGPTTPEQAAYIRSLLQTENEATKQPVFTQEQKRAYLQMRDKLTAAQLIKLIEKDMGIKPEQTLEPLF